MAQLHAGCIEGDGAVLFHDTLDFSPGNEEELRFVVDKAGDQPGAGYTVNVDVRTGYPFHQYLLTWFKSTREKSG
jgi:hypothetical protein